MNRLNDTKINQEQLKTLTLSKIIIEETLPLMNFLIQQRVINYNIELENFKERISTIKELIERALMDYSDKKITEIIWEETREISEKQKRNVLAGVKFHFIFPAGNFYSSWRPLRVWRFDTDLL